MEVFWYLLAGHLGIGTVRELKARMGMDEFLDWQIVYSMEPFGPQRGDMQAGIIASTICNALRGKNGKATKPGDFVLEFGPKKGKTVKQEQAFFMGLTKQMGGTIQ